MREDDKRTIGVVKSDDKDNDDTNISFSFDIC